MGLVCGSCGAELTEGARFCSSCGTATAGPARETRRVVTALFSDVVGSTALGERLDPEDFQALVGGAVARMASSVEAFGGEVFEYAGDGLLALFGAPIAHEDDPERAVLAGLRIIEAIEGYREEAASEWNAEGFAVRVGIETGLAVLGRVGGGTKLEYGAVGDALNTAARLQGEAEPGSVLVGPRTHALAAERFEFGEPRALALKGKAGEVEARPVRGPREAGTGAAAVSAELVGRGAELEAGLEPVADVLGGSGRILIVSGEAGVGKSRLVAELRRRFESGESAGGEPRWLEGRCVSYGEPLPYWPFRTLLREWLASASQDEVRPALDAELARMAPERADELRPAIEAVLGLAGEGDGPALPPEAAQQRIRDGVAEALERLAAEGPLAIVLDDLHWADASSLALLERLLELAERAPVLVVVNLRPERDHPAWALREHALRTLAHRAREIALATLGTDRGRELLEALLGGATLPGELERRLLDRAEGNPFYLEELVRSMVDSGSLRRSDGGWEFDREVPVEIPETVEKVVLARIDRLSPPAQELVGVAAVLGRQFPVPLLAAVSRTGELEGPLRELQSAELLRDAARWPVPFVAFSHTLIQEAAYRGLLKRRRQELHAAAVEATESLYADRLDEFAGMAAHHASAAGDSRRALVYHGRAGAAAEAVYALEEAIEHYDAALEAARDLGLADSEGDVRTALASRGRVHFSAGDLERARSDLERAVTAAEEAGDGEARVNASLDLVGYWRAHDFSRASELMEEVAQASDFVPPSARANALARLAILYVNQLRFDRAAEVARTALELAESESDGRATAQALDAMKLVALQTGDLAGLENITGRLREFLERSAESGSGREDAYYLSWVMLESAFVPLARGSFEEAIERIGEALELTRRMRARFQEPLFIDALCWAYRSKGDHERALRQGHEAVEVADEFGMSEWVAWTRATLGWAMLEAGEPAAAAECLEIGLETAEAAHTPAQLLRCTALLAWARSELGDKEAAARLRADCDPLFAEARTPPGRAWLFGAHAYVAAARADLALREPGRAIELLEPIAGAAERSGWIEPLRSAVAVIDEAATAAPRG